MNQEIKYNNATVRIHGTADNDKIRKAATDFLKKVEFQRRKENSKDGKRKVADR